MKIFKIHHSQLETHKPRWSYQSNFAEVQVCDSCGSEDSIVSNGDCGGCEECCSIENYSTKYLGLDGELYSDDEVDWETELLVGV